MKKLYLLTNSFPYGKGEKSFIIPELNYLKKDFEVTILSCATELEKCDISTESKLDNDIQKIHLKSSIFFIEKIFLLFMAHLHTELWREYRKIFHSKKGKIKNMYAAVVFYCYGLHFYYQLKKMPLNFVKGTIFYSYWYSYKALALVSLKRKYPDIKIITRTHGYDLYNERTTNGRQSFKEYMNNELDGIFFVSEAGYRYYKRMFLDGRTTPKLHVCRLGVPQKSKRNTLTNSNTFELVSCSNVIPLKRIELIIEGLVNCSAEMLVHWTHFGDGSSMQQITLLAERKLKTCKNISFTFYGYVSNQEIMKYYESYPVNCFITTSSTEGGSPVSIQEAISYGIPVIGTEVGGIPELVENNGKLLPATPTANEVTDAIKKIYYASEEQIEIWRENSYKLWKKKFDSDNNYEIFVEYLVNL